MNFPLNKKLYPIFDSHAHVLPASKKDESNYDVEVDLQFRSHLMDKVAIRAGLLMASNVYERPHGIADTRRQNDFVAWYRDAYPGRFPIAIGTIEPNHGRDVGIEEIHRMKEELGILGVVWHHHFNGSMMDEPRMIAFCQELARLGMVAFVHLNVAGQHESPNHLDVLAQRVPECTIVALGAFSSHKNMHDLRYVGERCSNVLFETSLAWPMGQPILEYVDRFGSERILFGTDMHYEPERSWLYPTGLVDILDSPRLQERDRENILWMNAERLFPVLEKVRAKLD